MNKKCASKTDNLDNSDRWVEELIISCAVSAIIHVVVDECKRRTITLIGLDNYIKKEDYYLQQNQFKGFNTWKWFFTNKIE